MIKRENLCNGCPECKNCKLNKEIEFMVCDICESPFLDFYYKFDKIGESDKLCYDCAVEFVRNNAEEFLDDAEYAAI